MRETAKAIIRYPFQTDRRILNSVVTVLDKVAVRRGQDDVYGLPGGTIERGETPEKALVREVAEELGLRIRKASKVGRVGRHHLFLVEKVDGIVDQNSMQLSEILGVGFLNSGRARRIPVERLQAHVKYVVNKLLSKKRGLQTDWPWGVNPDFKIRGYFFTGNRNRDFYDWEQQLRVIGAKRGFNANGW